MTGANVLTDFLKIMDKNSNDTEYRALALIWLDLVLKDIGGRQDGFHWRFLEAQTYFAVTADDYDYALTTIASDIDTTKVIHIFDRINDRTYRYVPYEVFKKAVADEGSYGGNPYIFTIYAGNLLLFPTPSFTAITGTADGTTANKLVDSTATFETNSIKVNMIATDTGTDDKALVTAVDSETALSLNDDIFVATDTYSVAWAVFMDYVKVVSDAADSAATILIPDKYKTVVYDGMKMHGLQFDPEMGNPAIAGQLYEAGIQRMKVENSVNIADMGRPISHRDKHYARDIDAEAFPLDDTNF